MTSPPKIVRSLEPPPAVGSNQSLAPSPPPPSPPLRQHHHPSPSPSQLPAEPQPLSKSPAPAPAPAEPAPIEPPPPPIAVRPAVPIEPRVTTLLGRFRRLRTLPDTGAAPGIRDLLNGVAATARNFGGNGGGDGEARQRSDDRPGCGYDRAEEYSGDDWSHVRKDRPRPRFTLHRRAKPNPSSGRRQRTSNTILERRTKTNM